MPPNSTAQTPDLTITPCGRLIHLREMPSGQWVAFEGYDQLHECETPPKQGASGKRKRASGMKNEAFPTDNFDSIVNVEYDDGILAVIQQALRERRVLRITYGGGTSPGTEREIEVLELTPPYFKAHCRMRREGRTFRLDRVMDAVLTDERFLRDNSFSLRQRQIENYRNITTDAYKSPPANKESSGCLIVLLMPISAIMIYACAG